MLDGLATATGTGNVANFVAEATVALGILQHAVETALEDGVEALDDVLLLLLVVLLKDGVGELARVFLLAHEIKLKF